MTVSSYLWVKGEKRRKIMTEFEKTNFHLIPTINICNKPKTQ